MSKIAILADSTSGLTQEMAKDYDNLFMIPLQVIFGEEETFLDGETISTKEFFRKCEEMYESKKVLPTTSQPSIGKCIEKYEEILKEFDEIIYFTISDKMSGTYQSGCLAADEFDGKVTVVNTSATAAPQLVTAFKAAELASKGTSKADILSKVEPLYKESSIYFVVSDLKHLQRTGRIGAAASVIGNALQLKPVLTLADGEVTAVEKVRNIKKAHKKVLSYVEEENISSEDLVCIVSGDADDYAKDFTDHINSKYPGVEIHNSELSPVIGVNTGPGIVGIVIFKNYHNI